VDGNKQSNDAITRRAVVGLVIAIAFCAICFILQILHVRDSPTAQLVSKNTETTPGISIGPAQCRANVLTATTKLPVNQALDPTTPTQSRRLIAYAIRSDGTTVFLFEPAEPHEPDHPTESKGLRSEYDQGTSRDATYSQEQRLQSTPTSPRVAENGSYCGQMSENTGRPKTVYVNGYYRKDGTYVRSHYRSTPHR
jgi:hypothetical protein